MAAIDPGEQRTVIMAAPLPPAPPGGREPAAPAGDRIEALDFVRGVALCGILLMNITAFGLPDAYTNPQNSGGATGANLLVWIVTEIGFEGTQRALFSMLFGASAILFMARLEAAGRPDAADLYVRRNLWLIAFGMINAFLLAWYGDILYAYGIIALFVFPFRNMAARSLMTIGIATLLLGAAWSLWEAREALQQSAAYEAAVAARDAGEENYDNAAISAWESARTEYVSTPESVARTTEAMRGGYVSAFWYVLPYNVYWQTWGLYRFFFDVFGMMLIGMALFRLGVLTLHRRTGVYVGMMLGGYAVGLTVNFLETSWIIGHQFSALSFAEANVSYDLGRLAMTVGHLGALLLFVRSGLLGWLRSAFAAVGRMAVTNYLMHSVICLTLFVLMGWYGQLERHQLYYVVFAIWAFQLVFSPLWLRVFRFGPLEWLWRWLTYLRRPPFLRA
ncbi:DUF418 domain-containing protein [Sphingosinicella sp.]|uniref:DUF418 domain-containing protein n=1 Tax=Sphingosinicella sp. TaxID=1917971 RepID=UPI0040378FE3